MLNKLKLPIAIGYTIILTILSLMTVHNIPSFGTDYDDKFYHILAYFLLTLIWYVAVEQTVTKKGIWQLAFYCCVFGIILEALQGKLTVDRVGDLLDIVANIIGVILAAILVLRRRKRLS
ncbi:MAG: VanZ family protein [Flavobacteriaceae bacterium]|nr:VanZ family protein [Flavobacteriaceae bacterium]